MPSPWVAMLGWGGDWPQGPVVMGSRPVGALTVALLGLGRLLGRCSPGLKQGPGDGASPLGGLSLLMSGQRRRRQGFIVWSDAWGREAGSGRDTVSLRFSNPSRGAPRASPVLRALTHLTFTLPLE